MFPLAFFSLFQNRSLYQYLFCDCSLRQFCCCWLLFFYIIFGCSLCFFNCSRIFFFVFFPVRSLLLLLFCFYFAHCTANSSMNFEFAHTKNTTTQEEDNKKNTHTPKISISDLRNASFPNLIHLIRFKLQWNLFFLKKSVTRLLFETKIDYQVDFVYIFK